MFSDGAAAALVSAKATPTGECRLQAREVRVDSIAHQGSGDDMDAGQSGVQDVPFQLSFPILLGANIQPAISRSSNSNTWQCATLTTGPFIRGKSDSRQGGRGARAAAEQLCVSRDILRRTVTSAAPRSCSLLERFMQEMNGGPADQVTLAAAFGPGLTSWSQPC